MDLKHVILILSVEVSITGCMLAQMPGMANHHQQPPKATIAPHNGTQNSNVTFTKDIAPIVQQHCQSCHRPGEGTPFSLLTYESAKPWVDDIKDMVQQRAMPPWFEDGHTEKFENNPSLTQAQIDTIVAWVNAGAPKGNPKDMPEAPHFIQGWTIPKPDVVYQLPKLFPIPATGVLQYQYVIVPTGFDKDTWIQDAEAAQTDRTVVHHIVAYVRTPGSNYFNEQPMNTFFEAPPAKKDVKAEAGDVPSDWLVGYAPGQPA